MKSAERIRETLGSLDRTKVKRSANVKIDDATLKILEGYRRVKAVQDGKSAKLESLSDTIANLIQIAADSLEAAKQVETRTRSS